MQPSGAAAARPAAVQPSYGVVMLRYLERSPIRVRGPVSGRQYEFSAAEPVRAVDSRDVAPLLATKFFGRA